MKKQIVIIHGGETFARYRDYWNFLQSYELDRGKIRQAGLSDWKDTLAVGFGSNYEIIRPRMPNALNAKYKEWALWFGKYLPFLRHRAILLGHSLGAIFLIKYLAENEFTKKIAATLLVAAPYDDKDSEYSLADFRLPRRLDNLARQGGRVIFYHSRDDRVVPFADLDKYRSRLPQVEFRIFKNRGHFNQAGFPEIKRDIKALC